MSFRHALHYNVYYFMKTKRTKVRPLYEKITGKKLPKNFDIHHIDFNPENNEILNLVAIPRQLHKQYHKALYNLAGNLKLNIDFTILRRYDAWGNLVPHAYHVEEYYFNQIRAFFYINQKVREWTDFRDCLLGLFSNSYKIDITCVVNY